MNRMFRTGSRAARSVDEITGSRRLRRMRKAEFEPLRRHRSEVSATLEQVVKKALSLKASQRYLTAADFRDALMRLQQQMGRPFGRSELSVLMLEIFDAERRQRRSPSYSGSMELVRPAQPRPAQPRDPQRSTAPAPVQLESGPARGGDPVDALDATTLASSSSRRAVPAPAAPESAPERDRGRGQPQGRVAFAPPTLSESAVHGRGLDAAPSARPVAAEIEAETNALYALDDHDLEELDEAGTRRQGLTDRRTRAAAPGPARGAGEAPVPRRDRPYHSRVGAGAFHRQETQQVRRELHGEPTNILQDGRETQATLAATPAAGRALAAHVAPGTAEQTDLSRERLRSRRRPSVIGRLLIGALVVALLGAALVFGRDYLDRTLPQKARVSLDGGGPSASRLDQGARDAPRPGVHRPAPSPGLVRVKSQPPGAAIILCGLDTGKVTPATVRTRVGRRCELALQLEEHETYRLPVSVRAGQTLNVAVTLRRAAPPPSTKRGALVVEKGTLRVTSIQVGAVFVDDRRVGSTPRLDLELPPGTYSVKVYFSTLEQQTSTRQVTIRAGRTSKVHFDPS